MQCEVSPSDSHYGSISYKIDDAKRSFLTESAQLWKLVESQLANEYELFERQNSVTGKVRRILLNNLPTRNFSLKQLHEQINMSPSTLQRRLREENTNFKYLLDNTRKELAMIYLKNPDVSIEEVSFMLGYTEPNSFFRSFKRLTGNTPGEYRKHYLEKEF